MNLPYTLLLGDTLERMKEIPDGNVDMVMCDLPYGTTACKWDAVIPFAPLWEAYRRVCKPRSAIVLTASQPFTSALVMSNAKEFRYCWTWIKERGTGFARSGFQPLRQTEDVVVFSKSPAVFCKTTKAMQYNPQMVKLDEPYFHALPIFKSGSDPVWNDNGTAENRRYKEYTHRHPTNIIKAARDGKKVHPTQKPVALMEYLIRTYTTEGQTVLDNTMGSGTTGVACVNLGRNFIGIERDESYFAIAKQRIEAAYVSPGQPTPPSKPKNNEKPQAATEEGFQQCSLF